MDRQYLFCLAYRLHAMCVHVILKDILRFAVNCLVGVRELRGGEAGP